MIAASVQLFVVKDIVCEFREPWIVNTEVPDDIIVFFFEGFEDFLYADHMCRPFCRKLDTNSLSSRLALSQS